MVAAADAAIVTEAKAEKKQARRNTGEPFS